MKINRLPPIEKLRRLFAYDPETGVVTRKVTVSANNAKKGDVVGWKHEGYLLVTVGKKKWALHRICYAIYHGFDPYPYEIDHINHKKNDNRICNLRLVTHQENMKNYGKREDNTSGVTGVSFDKFYNKWGAIISINGRKKKLGNFENKADAIAARRAAEIKCGFHKNHGHQHDAPEQEPPVEISDKVRQLSLRLIQPVDDESTQQKQSQECRA